MVSQGMGQSANCHLDVSLSHFVVSARTLVRQGWVGVLLALAASVCCMIIALHHPGSTGISLTLPYCWLLMVTAGATDTPVAPHAVLY
jgi:hypothetical protein